MRLRFHCKSNRGCAVALRPTAAKGLESGDRGEGFFEARLRGCLIASADETVETV